MAAAGSAIPAEGRQSHIALTAAKDAPRARPIAQVRTLGIGVIVNLALALGELHGSRGNPCSPSKWP